MSATPEPSGHPEPLVAEPLVRTEVKIGYARVSTGGQKLERQIDALTAAECRKVFSDKKPGKTDLRPELKACHAFRWATSRWRALAGQRRVGVRRRAGSPDRIRRRGPRVGRGRGRGAWSWPG
ncbi:MULTISPECIES: recombinase family protein [unclassified Streptomyces]|uniref:recombinase family protein n=1 Tax=unclassified Streptomyces TaxID=2593676 RepID=UPI00336A845D